MLTETGIARIRRKNVDDVESRMRVVSPRFSFYEREREKPGIR